MSTSWVISMTFVPELPLEDKQLDALSERFDEQDWTVAVAPDFSVSVTAYIDDEPILMTAPLVVDIAARALRDVGAPSELVKVELMTEERREIEAQHPPLPELLAATDVAKALGVSRQRVSQLQRGHRDFPHPVAYTGAGSLWVRSAVDRFATVWDRRPGRRTEDEHADVVELHLKTGRTAALKGVKTALNQKRATQQRIEA